MVNIAHMVKAREIKGKYGKIRVINAKLVQIYVNSGKCRQVRPNKENNILCQIRVYKPNWSK